MLSRLHAPLVITVGLLSHLLSAAEVGNSLSPGNISPWDGETSPHPSAAHLTISASAAENIPPRIVTGAVKFTNRTIGFNVDQTHSVVAADLDGDEDVDVVATDYVDASILWYENDGSGNFVSHVLDAGLSGAYPAHVADVDLDGDADVLACGYLANTIVWYDNNGNGSFTRMDVDTAADGAHSVVTADMDQDGDIDLLATTQDAGAIAWYENDGSNNFTPHIVNSTSTGAKRAEFADVDGDGDLDVVSACWDIDEIAWHENDGEESFTKRLIDNTADGAYFVFPTDIDGDADIDVLSASELDDTIGLYVNDGAGAFTSQIIDNEAGGSRTVVAVDVDRDGDVDVVAASVDDDTVSWYENDGVGSFRKRVVDVAADGAYGVFTIDMDRDGDVDILSARRDANTVAVHYQSKSHQALLEDAGGIFTIDADHLHTEDLDDGPAELIYRITDEPASGTLRLDGLPVPAGGTFSQSDINNSRLSYVHTDSLSLIDQFSFTVADGGEGGFRPLSACFSINIFAPMNRLLAHWPLDEAAGPVAQDVAGQYDGTLFGTPVWQPSGGRVGGSLEFDGIDDYVNIGSIDVAESSGLTVAMWVRPSSFIGESRLISKATGVAEQDHYWMIGSFSESALRFRLKSGGATSTLITEENELKIGVWSHVACTYGEHEMRIYRDGMLVASRIKTGALDVNPTVEAAIGDQPPGAGSRPFAGDIDDVRIYARAMTGEEIATLVNSAPNAVGIPGEEPQVSAGLILAPPSPNPVRSGSRWVTLLFSLAEADEVRVELFGVDGGLVAQRVPERFAEPGEHRIRWDLTTVPPGIYFLRLLTSRGFEQHAKLTVLQ